MPSRPGLLQQGQQAQRLDDRHAARLERVGAEDFVGVHAGMLFEKRDAGAEIREEYGGGASGDAAAHYDDVIVI
ncbi:hypothetical protein GCM10010149_79910 [Nonomuraea roseoviolacea subsp. roseoviolacea]